MMRSVSMEHARGALLGLFVGDAAGATLEFFRDKVSLQMARRAMRMPGSGWVGPGQVTDDSELAIALATALACRDPLPWFAS
ncbi:hypothetical protein L7F22_008380 [Adiantum nelumboides]|nr:hypothetical protein [Adiantum nelumboides]